MSFPNARLLEHQDENSAVRVKLSAGSGFGGGERAGPGHVIALHHEACAGERAIQGISLPQAP